MNYDIRLSMRIAVKRKAYIKYGYGFGFDKTALKVPAKSNPKRNIDAKETVH